MQQHLNTRIAQLCPYNKLTWDDIPRVESPASAYHLLQMTRHNVPWIPLAFNIDTTPHHHRMLAYAEPGNERDPRWQEVLDQVLNGELCLTIDKPTAPAVRWQDDKAHPLGGRWEPVATAFNRRAQAGLIFLQHQIQMLTILRQVKNSPLTPPAATQAKSEPEKTKDDEFDAYVQLTSGDEPLRSLPVRITAADGKVTETSTDAYGFLKIPAGWDDQEFSLQILRDRKTS